MKTAKEILDSKMHFSGAVKERILEAMEEYASYWQRRCEAAEKFILESPCDPDITEKQTSAYNAWNTIILEGDSA